MIILLFPYLCIYSTSFTQKLVRHNFFFVPKSVATVGLSDVTLLLAVDLRVEVVVSATRCSAVVLLDIFVITGTESNKAEDAVLVKQPKFKIV